MPAHAAVCDEALVAGLLLPRRVGQAPKECRRGLRHRRSALRPLACRCHREHAVRLGCRRRLEAPSRVGGVLRAEAGVGSFVEAVRIEASSLRRCDPRRRGRRREHREDRDDEDHEDAADVHEIEATPLPIGQCFLRGPRRPRRRASEVDPTARTGMILADTRFSARGDQPRSGLVQTCALEGGLNPGRVSLH